MNLGILWLVNMQMQTLLWKTRLTLNISVIYLNCRKGNRKQGLQQDYLRNPKISKIRLVRVFTKLLRVTLSMMISKDLEHSVIHTII